MKSDPEIRFKPHPQVHIMNFATHLLFFLGLYSMLAATLEIGTWKEQEGFEAGVFMMGMALVGHFGLFFWKASYRITKDAFEIKRKHLFLNQEVIVPLKDVDQLSMSILVWTVSLKRKGHRTQRIGQECLRSFGELKDHKGDPERPGSGHPRDLFNLFKELEERIGAYSHTIYVKLLDEGVEVWKPVMANYNAVKMAYVIRDKPALEEAWEFMPGSLVVVEEKILGNERALVATREWRAW